MARINLIRRTLLAATPQPDESLVRGALGAKAAGVQCEPKNRTLTRPPLGSSCAREPRGLADAIGANSYINPREGLR